jgi:hypothetical protein
METDREFVETFEGSDIQHFEDYVLSSKWLAESLSLDGGTIEVNTIILSPRAYAVVREIFNISPLHEPEIDSICGLGLIVDARARRPCDLVEMRG